MTSPSSGAWSDNLLYDPGLSSEVAGVLGSVERTRRCARHRNNFQFRTSFDALHSCEPKQAPLERHLRQVREANPAHGRMLLGSTGVSSTTCLSSGSPCLEVTRRRWPIDAVGSWQRDSEIGLQGHDLNAFAIPFASFDWVKTQCL